jgi:tetratricopeptide (TPR) repeat protein
MKAYKRSETIEKYLQGKLSGEELISFENELKSNKSLADEVKLYMEIDGFLKNKNVIDLGEMLDEIHEEVTSQEISTTKKKKKGIIHVLFLRWQYAAAVLVFLIGISTVLFYTLRPSLNERIYNQYYVPFEGSTFMRSDDQQAASEMQLALNEYNDENFEKAWTMLKNISDKNIADAEAYFFRGISAMEINDLNDAIASFNNVISNDSSLYNDEALWYLALCYLKMDNKIKALLQFSKVVETNSNHKVEAEEIIERMK